MDNKVAVKTVLVTLGAAFVLLAVVEWKKFADQLPNGDDSLVYGGVPVPGMPNKLVCYAQGPIPANAPGGVNPMPLDACEKVFGTNVPWDQGIKAFVYLWIGVGLLVAAFIKNKGGVAGGYW